MMTNIRWFLFISFISYAASNYVCSDTECYDCTEDTCHMTCQGKECSVCPDGSCCNGKKCNACIQSLCCPSTKKCNKCVYKNRASCDSSSNDCNTLIQEKCNLTMENQDSSFTQNNGNLNNNNYNVKTIINLKNVINTTNFIDKPINVNVKNTKDLIVNTTEDTKGYLKNANIGQHRKNCCTVVHPQECHKISKIPDKVCFTRRHMECSNNCKNSTNILIIANQGDIEDCIIIGSYPYYYCGYFGLEDCSSCYNCEEINKINCMNADSCSDSCRSSILPNKFYNRPYHIKEDATDQDSPPLQ